MRRSTYTVALTLLFSVATFMIFLPLPTRRPAGSLPARSVLGSGVKSVNCRVYRSLPDPDCTPGAIDPKITSADICRADFVLAQAPVSAGLANQIYLQYGIYSPESQEYQIDRLIGESLGGSDDVANLWPQPAEPRPGFHEKDRAEKYLHDEVCAGKISLRDAQNQLASDWLKVFLSQPSF